MRASSENTSKSIGYLAGMIDGEGYISVSKGVTSQVTKRGYTSASPRYALNVAVTGTNLKLMQWLVGHFGGDYNQDKPNKDNPEWKNRITWKIFGAHNKLLLLKLILPYLVMKRRQAELAIEFLEMNGERNPVKREEIRQEMLKLNKRGKTVEANTQDVFSATKKKRFEPPFLEPALRMMIESELGCEFENDAAVTL